MRKEERFLRMQIQMLAMFRIIETVDAKKHAYESTQNPLPYTEL